MSLKRWTGVSSKRGNSWQDILGYTVEQAYDRLMGTMPTGCTWADFESGALHIDHIRPVSKFTFSSYSDPEFKECWALSNLQLLPAFDNMSKWNRLDWQPATA